MISNTATPKYYGQFREAVLSGEMPVCQTISMEMCRIDRLIANPTVWYDPAPVEGYVKYCERELTLTDGDDLVLLPSFKLWAEQIFGWYYFEPGPVFIKGKDGEPGRYVTKNIRRRLIHKQYLIVGRRASKSLYASTIQNYFLNIDTSTTHQIAVAPTMRQAEEVMSPIKTAMAKARGPLMKFLTEGSINNTTGSKANRVKVASTKKGVQNFLTNSLLEVRPLSIDSLQGLRCKVASLDEWLSGEIKENPIEAIEGGAKKIPDWLILCTSSEGTIRHGVGDTIKITLMDILRGEFVDPHTSIFYYKLDNIQELKYPFMWKKANPNIGVTTSETDYMQDVEKAEKIPSLRNEILAKMFNIPMEGYTYYFTYEEATPGPPQEFWNMPCAMGCDLSQGDDFCAFTFLFPLGNGKFGVKTRSYITTLTQSKLTLAMRMRYDDFINEGTLVIMDTTVLDLMLVYDDLQKFIDAHQYSVECVGYDPYNAKEFIERWARDNGPYGIEKVIQGVKTESVPLGELKKLAENRMLLFDEQLMEFAMQNSVVNEDSNGNRKLHKKRHQDKIDNVAALMDAFVAYKLNKDYFE